MPFVMVPVKKTGGKKHRKHGRNKKKPCHQRYNFEQRWNSNKIRKAQKHANHLKIVVMVKVDGEWVSVRPKKKS